MMYTTVPAWLISAALMLWLLPNVAAHDMNSVEAFRAQLEATGLVHAYSLIPLPCWLSLPDARECHCSHVVYRYGGADCDLLPQYA